MVTSILTEMALLESLSRDFNAMTMVLVILDIFLLLIPLMIYFKADKLLKENNKLKSEITEIKNLLMIQNEILRNGREPK